MCALTHTLPDLVGRTNLRGEPVPALLVVLCSPRAVEIKIIKELGKAGHILPWMPSNL